MGLLMYWTLKGLLKGKVNKARLRES